MEERASQCRLGSKGSKVCREDGIHDPRNGETGKRDEDGSSEHANHHAGDLVLPPGNFCIRECYPQPGDSSQVDLGEDVDEHSDRGKSGRPPDVQQRLTETIPCDCSAASCSHACNLVCPVPLAQSSIPEMASQELGRHIGSLQRGRKGLTRTTEPVSVSGVFIEGRYRIEDSHSFRRPTACRLHMFRGSARILCTKTGSTLIRVETRVNRSKQHLPHIAILDGLGVDDVPKIS